jgi:hypothetical protein
MTHDLGPISKDVGDTIFVSHSSEHALEQHLGDKDAITSTTPSKYLTK